METGVAGKEIGMTVEERGVRIPMRDGVHLVADVVRPDDPAPVPVLVERTPYGRAAVLAGESAERLVAAGFAVVVQDCRGRFDSEGEWRYVRAEVDDGYDTVEWAAAQRWSNGRVGMFGASYMGNAQWMAAIARPPHLVAIAPECCPADYWCASFEPGGVFRLALRMSWAAGSLAAMADQWGIDDPRLAAIAAAGTASHQAIAAGDRDAILAAGERVRSVLHDVYRERPMRGGSLWHGRAGILDECFDHERREDAHWRHVNPSSHYDQVDLPAVHVAGWYDIHLTGTLANFVGMRRQAPTGEARAAQRLVVGPWGHWAPQDPVVGDVDFGPQAAVDTVRLRLDWFRHWLQDGPEPDWAPVRIFVMGDDTWRDEQEWPLSRTVWTPWYLGAGGRLGPVPPASDDPPDAFAYDPAHPAPTVGGRLLALGEIAGPRDQRSVGERPDVLTYASPVLEGRWEITGPVSVELWAATDAPDTDFTALLVDIHPDGRALNVCEGAVRARHVVPVPLQPGAAYRFDIDLAATSIALGPGHRLELRISSSSFPEWEPNPNTGNPLGSDGPGDHRTARQTVFHDARHPSRVLLPVIPG